MSVLAGFQEQFACALFEPEAGSSGAVAALRCQPGFAVYRNTAMKGCVDALQANYASVSRLVGEEWFRAAAAVYVREQPPAQPTLLFYGATFAQFLARFEPARKLPYLPAVARLDRLWTEAHVAADAIPLDPDQLRPLPPEALGAIRLRPHTAARWAWFADVPAYSIWSRTRTGADIGELDWTGEAALLTRPYDAVRWMPLDEAGCAFLDACGNSASLAEAAEAVGALWPQTDLAQLLALLISAGAFAALENTQ